MRINKTITVTLLAGAALLSACSRDVVTVAATPVAAAATPVTAAPVSTLPADVRGIAKATSEAQKKSAIEVAAAKPEIQQFLEATGELTSPMRSEVAPRIAGRIAAVYVREGMRVHAGQPMAELETEYARLDLQRAEAELARLNVLEADARRELARKRELLTTESVSRASVDRVETSFEAAIAAKRSALATVATARQRLSDSTLRAPFEGAVASRAVDTGEHVSDGTPAFVIVQTSPLKLRFRLPEQYLGQLHEGQKVQALVDAQGGESFTGRITMIGGVIDPSTRTLVAEADIANSDGRLRPGMFARVNVDLHPDPQIKK